VTLLGGCSQGVPGSGGITFGSGQASASASASDSSSVSGISDSYEGGSSAGEESAGDEAPATGSSTATTGDDASSSASVSAGSSGAPGECGDGVVDGDETCDGDALAGTCADYGYDEGVLVCDAECNHITEGCFTCGDGMKALGEACDGNDFDGDTCVGLGFGGGSLSCSGDCQTVVTSGCTALPSCGDGILNGGEQCDGAQLGGASCITQGFDMGALSCTAQCTFNTSQCMDDIGNCTPQGEFCVFDENNPQSTCCPAGVGGNVLGICDIIFCV
jgi:hypothetical protein